MPFADRYEAGRRLATQVAGLGLHDPVVLGLPRGGVPVAAEVARALDAPLDVLLVRKLGCPWQPELGIGAIGEDGIRLINEDLRRQARVSDEDLEVVAEREHAELERRLRTYRQGRPPVDLTGRTVVIVDDGLATGFTARAGIEVVRRRGAAQVVLAVPVAPPDTVAELGERLDEVVCLETPPWFTAIGAFYRDFGQTSDEEVIELLEAARERAGTGAAGDGDDGDRHRGRADDPAVGPSTDPTDDPRREIEITVGGGVVLPGELAGPLSPLGVVVFAHGSGSSRHSPRNLAVARHLNDAGMATLLFDLLTGEEDRDRAKVFDIDLLAERLVAVTRWVQADALVGQQPIGYFGASTGAAAALTAAATLGDDVAAVVSRGGRPDLAWAHLPEVAAPTLLIVGARDAQVLELNQRAREQLRCHSHLETVPDASHLFEEPGALETVAVLAAGWFRDHLASAG